MNILPIPQKDVRMLRSGRKNLTLRFSNQLGLYKRLEGLKDLALVKSLVDSRSFKLKKGMNSTIFKEGVEDHAFDYSGMKDNWYTLYHSGKPVSLATLSFRSGKPKDAIPMLAYAVKRSERGKGYAPVAIVRAGRIALKKHGGFWAVVDVNNLPSVKSLLGSAFFLREEDPKREIRAKVHPMHPKGYVLDITVLQ